MAKITTIQLHHETRDRLASHGGKDSTFEEIVCKVLDAYEANNGGKK